MAKQKKNADPVIHNDLIQEVEEAVKQEQLETLWKEYGPYIIAGAVMAVLFTAAITGWRSWNESVDKTNTTMLVDALEQDDIAAAMEEITSDLRPGPRALAYFSEANLLLQSEKEQDARARYEQAAQDKSLEPLWRDLATIMAIRLTQDDTGETADQSLARLRPIAENKKSPWIAQARLEAARLMAHAQGDYKGASAYLEPVIDSATATPSLKQRALALQHIYDITDSESKTESKQP